MSLFPNTFGDIRRRFRQAVAGGTTPMLIGGIAVGSVGTGVYAGFRLAFGDDYDAVPTAYDFATKTGKSTSGRMQNAARRGQNSNALTHEVVMNSAYRGSRSQSPAALGLNPAASAGSSILRITPVPTVSTSGYASLQTNYDVASLAPDTYNKPSLYSAHFYNWPQMLFSQQGDFAFEGKFKPDAGKASGMQAALWTSGVSWPDYGEIDLWELRKSTTDNTTSARQSLHESLADGGADQNVVLATTPTLPTSRYTTILGVKQGSTIKLYDDIAVEGTLALRTTYTNAMVGRLRGAADIRLGMYINNSWDTSTYLETDWSNQGISVDWFRLWLPAGTSDIAPIIDLGTVQTTPGGTWNFTIPADSVLYGGRTPDLTEIYGAYAEEDSPGCSTKSAYASPPGPGLNFLPGGMAISGKSITGQVPTTEGGRMALMFAGTFSAGGPATRAMLFYDVAPAVQALWDNLPVATGQSPTFQIPYWAFHSGNLGHTYTAVTSDKAWAVPTIASDKRSASVAVSGAQTAGDVATISISATNSSGQTTTVTRTISAQAKAIYLYDSFTPLTGDQEDIKVHAPEIGGVWRLLNIGTEAQGGRLDIRGYFVGMSPGNSTYYNDGATFADGFVEAAIRTDTILTGDSIGLGLRMVGGSVQTLYYACYNPATGNLEINKRVTGTNSLIASVAYSPTVGGVETLRFTAVGNVLTLYVNGTQVVTGTDSTSPITAAGYPGIRCVTKQSSTNGRHILSLLAGGN